MRNYLKGLSTARALHLVCAASMWCTLALGLWMGTGSSALADPPLLTNPPLAPSPPVTANSPLTTDSPITRDSPTNVDWFIADQFTFDDNLYRLPTYLDVTTVAGPQARREDGFNSLTLGGDGRWFADNQTFGFDIRADDNRFIHNTSLDNISGKGKLDWNWQLATTVRESVHGWTNSIPRLLQMASQSPIRAITHVTWCKDGTISAAFDTRSGRM